MYFFAHNCKLIWLELNDLSKKSGDHLRVVSGWSPDDFRWDNIAGPHGTSCFKGLLHKIDSQWISSCDEKF
jgi:hypothetical protein